MACKGYNVEVDFDDGAFKGVVISREITTTTISTERDLDSM